MITSFGGNTEFWQDKEVAVYNHKQSMLIEQKDFALNNIVKIINYFIKKHKIIEPNILDFGCGQGALSFKLLDHIPECIVTGVDASEQMLDVARRLYSNPENDRFKVYSSDFNNENFWISEIDNNYDFIVSSLALQFMSNERIKPFFNEVHKHLNENGVFILYLANCSSIKEIQDMEQTFRIEFCFNNLSEEKRQAGFNEYKDKYLEMDKKANINWNSPSHYINALREVGLNKADIVWHLWTYSILLAIK